MTHWEGVVAYDTGDVLVYDFVSITEAAKHTNIRHNSIVANARHQTWYTSDKDGKKLRWEYKDDQKSSLMPERPIQKKLTIKLYFIDDEGCERGFTSLADAVRETKGGFSFTTQSKHIKLSLKSNGTIACKSNKLWYVK